MVLLRAGENEVIAGGAGSPFVFSVSIPGPLVSAERWTGKATSSSEGLRIFGDEVHVAARLEGLAEPRGICVSARVFATGFSGGTESSQTRRWRGQSRTNPSLGCRLPRQGVALPKDDRFAKDRRAEIRLVLGKPIEEQ